MLFHGNTDWSYLRRFTPSEWTLLGNWSATIWLVYKCWVGTLVIYQVSRNISNRRRLHSFALFCVRGGKLLRLTCTCHGRPGRNAMVSWSRGFQTRTPKEPGIQPGFLTTSHLRNLQHEDVMSIYGIYIYNHMYSYVYNYVYNYVCNYLYNYVYNYVCI